MTPATLVAMRSVAVLVVAGLGCSSHPRERPAPPPADARVPVTADAPIDAPLACAPGVAIANGACTTSADCVLTDLADACDACNLDRPYPTTRAAFDHRAERCGNTQPCTRGCPPHDTYTRAFYRAECREHRCIAWRYHGGG